MASTRHAILRDSGQIRNGRPPKYSPGDVFGELRLLERMGNRAIFECSCNNVIEVSIGAVIQGGKRDCGHVAKLKEAEQPEQKRGDMLYWIWQNMKARCQDPYNPAYKDYGARGITIDPSWEDFNTFKSDIGARPGMEYSLDRIDANGNYEPSNIRWATAIEQANNKRKPIRE